MNNRTIRSSLRVLSRTGALGVVLGGLLSGIPALESLLPGEGVGVAGVASAGQVGGEGSGPASKGQKRLKKAEVSGEARRETREKLDGASARRGLGATPWRASFASHQWRNALPGLRKELADNPDDPELHAYAAIASAKIGRYADALLSFESAIGSEFYEAKGLDEHATTLRVTGHVEEAVQLRREALASAPRALGQVQIAFNLADDLRAAGDLQGAEDAAYFVLSETPGLEEVYALFADIALDAGDLEEAELQLWYADIYGVRTARTRAARGRLQLAYGDLDAAFDEVAAGRMRTRNHLPWAIQAEVLRRSGNPAAGLNLVESAFLPDKERPDMTAAKLACLASLGELEEAEDLRQWALDVYPRDPSVRAASQVLDRALERAAKPQL